MPCPEVDKSIDMLNIIDKHNNEILDVICLNILITNTHRTILVKNKVSGIILHTIIRRGHVFNLEDIISKHFFQYAENIEKEDIK